MNFREVVESHEFDLETIRSRLWIGFNDDVPARGTSLRLFGLQQDSCGSQVTAKKVSLLSIDIRSIYKSKILSC